MRFETVFGLISPQLYALVNILIKYIGVIIFSKKLKLETADKRPQIDHLSQCSKR